MKSICKALLISSIVFSVATANAAGVGRMKIRTEKDKFVNSGSIEAIQKANQAAGSNTAVIRGVTATGVGQLDYKSKGNTYVNSGSIKAVQDVRNSAAANRAGIDITY